MLIITVIFSSLRLKPFIQPYSWAAALNSIFLKNLHCGPDATYIHKMNLSKFTFQYAISGDINHKCLREEVGRIGMRLLKLRNYNILVETQRTGWMRAEGRVVGRRKGFEGQGALLHLL
jgi:hypothetical protein